jgi:hypothetical protein
MRIWVESIMRIWLEYDPVSLAGCYSGLRLLNCSH